MERFHIIDDIANIKVQQQPRGMTDDRYIFVVEWFDTAAALVRTYNLTFFAIDGTIEMFDLKNKKIFLRRCEYPSVQLKDLFIGAVVTIYSRQLKVVDYSDQFTRKNFEVQRGKAFALIKPDAYLNIGRILSIVESSGFTLGNLKMFRFGPQEAEEFYADHKSKNYFQTLVQHVSSDLVVGLQLINDDCINRWSRIMGPDNPKDAKKESPNSIRALFGEDAIKNAIYGSESQTGAQKELDFTFSSKSKLRSPAFFNNCTCCVIKPHIISEGRAGAIIDFILSEGFEISAMQMFWLDRPTAEEFLEVYKGVVPQFPAMAQEFTTGPCIAMEIRQDNAVTSFREVCGPHDPDLARAVRPKSIRANFGRDKIKNAVHCTDLVDDGVLEVEYFFNILQQK